MKRWIFFAVTILTVAGLGVGGTLLLGHGDEEHEGSMMKEGAMMKHEEGSMRKEKESHKSETSKSKSKKITLEAHVIDLVCYTTMNEIGKEHIGCAEYCVNEQGIPLGLLDNKTGEIYLLFGRGHVSPNKFLKPYIEQNVRVTGELIEKGGIKAIKIKRASQIEPLVEPSKE